MTMRLNELFEQADHLDEQGKGAEIYSKYRFFIEGINNVNHVNGMKFLLTRMLMHTSLSEEHKKQLLDLLHEKGCLIQLLDAARIARMLDKYPRYFYYCINKLGDHKQTIIDALNSDDFIKELLLFPMLPPETFRWLINYGFLPERVDSFFQDPKSELSDWLSLQFPHPISGQDSQAYHDFYNSNSVQRKSAEIFICLLEENGKIDADSFRNLINKGVYSPGDIVQLFQSCDSEEAKTMLINLFASPFFKPPSVEDTQAYRDFYESDFVQIILPELRHRMRLSLLFPTGDSQATFGSITFDRDGGSFKDDFSYVKNSYLNLIQKELKDFTWDILKNFSDKEKERILKIISDLMKSSPKDHNRIVLLSTDRGGFHAEGLLLFDDLFLRVNRATGSFPKSRMPGITILSRDLSRSNEEMKYISEVESLSARDVVTPGDALDQKINAIGLESLDFIEMMPQSMGNCSLATSKAFVLASCYVAIRKILSERGLKDKTLHVEASALAYKIYKAFTRLYRLEEAKSYLVWSAKHQFKYIDEKILSKMIGYFGSEISIKAIIEKNNLLGSLSQDSLVIAIKRAIKMASLEENSTLIQALMGKLQLLNVELAERQVEDFLSATEGLLDGWSCSETERCGFRKNRLKIFNALIQSLDSSVQTRLLHRMNEIFPENIESSIIGLLPNEGKNNTRKFRVSNVASIEKRALEQQTSEKEAMSFLEDTKRMLKTMRSQEALNAFKENRLKILNALIRPLDAPAQTSLLHRMNEIFDANVNAQKMNPKTMPHASGKMSPQFDSLHRISHEKPSESPKGDTRPSPSMGP